MKGTEALVCCRIVQKETFMEYTGAYNGKSSRPNYWHGLCFTDCEQMLLAGMSVVTKNTSYNFFLKSVKNLTNLG